VRVYVCVWGGGGVVCVYVHFGTAMTCFILNGTTPNPF
jgi:hypothetical protein